MNRSIRFASMTCVLAVCCLSLPAVEPVMPPADLPQETWLMTYNDYHALSSDSIPRWKEEAKPVTFAWTDTTVYVKGIFSDFPGSWIKGYVNGSEVRFDYSQFHCESDKAARPVYALSGIAYHGTETGDNSYTIFRRFTRGPECLFKLSDDRRSISSRAIPANDSSTPCYTAFWHNSEPEDITYSRKWNGDEESGSGFPETDFRVNVRFSKADEPVAPPADLTVESWVMTYDSYQSLRPDIGGRTNLTREVSVVKDDCRMYIKGVLSDFPESWIRGTVIDGSLHIDNVQVSGVADGVPVYFKSGYAFYQYMSGMEPEDYRERIALMYGENRQVYTISGDGNSMESEVEVFTRSKYPGSSSYTTAFWAGSDTGCESIERPYQERDCPVNIRFSKAEGGGIEGITPSERPSDSITYDMHGRQVNPDRLLPGIYIRDGKKILIK